MMKINTCVLEVSTLLLVYGGLSSAQKTEGKNSLAEAIVDNVYISIPQEQSVTISTLVCFIKNYLATRFRLI
jgi:hypothetical protein